MKKYFLAIFFALCIIAGIIIVAEKYQLPFLKPVLPIIAIIVGIIPNILYIYYNELEKRNFELHKRTIDRKFELYKMRESTYRELIKGMRGFYQDGNQELKELFFENLRVAWLYSPDHVIKKANEFVALTTPRPDLGESNRQKLTAKLFGELILEFRKDLIDIKETDTTSLTPNDIKHVGAKPNPLIREDADQDNRVP